MEDHRFGSFIMTSGHLLITAVFLILIIFCFESNGQQYGQVEFRIKEQMPSGTNVGSILEKARIEDKVAKIELKNLSFKFLNPNNLMQTASLFSINSDNGAIYTTAMIDRESVCQFLKNCNVEFDVTVTSSVSKFFEIVSVRIVIEDINDNSPRFPNDEVTLYVPESVNVNSEFRISGATDKDTNDENSISKYEMKSDYNEMFDLKSEMKLDWTWDLSIVILKPLDREVKDHYVLQIIAKDNGNPPRSGNVTVHINVTDTNDNPPVFTENTYEVSVSEQAEIGAVVGQVKALDLDKGMNAAVTYKFSMARSTLMEDLFYIDTQNGEVKVKNDLQYEAGKSFETIVVASDRGNPPRASQAILIINVIDVGNTPPRIAVNPVPNPEGNTLSITEASPVETVVAHVSTDDRDSGLNGVVDCSSVSPKFKVRRFEGSGFLVEIAHQLDREYEEEVNVTIICEDRGAPKLSAIGWFMIKLLDANDNEPTFTKTIYRANLTENNRKGERVLTVKAFDKDIGENANIRYSFSVVGDEPSFVIDSVTGDITAGQEYDRETVSQVSFVVMAQDGGGKQGKTSVIVDILDQNDNSPYFTSSLEFQVAENLMAGSTVDTLEAKDRDDGLNAEVCFQIPRDTFNTNANLPFVVIPNGIIRTTSILDKDKQALYKFPVIVKDKGHPSRSSSAYVTVHVIDSNDHKPVFHFPSRTNNTLRFRSNASPGSFIGRLIATDDDIGRNAKLKYNIISGNHERVFVMPDSNSGEIRLTNDSELLYGLQTNMFRLNVSVRDQGIPMLEATAILHIQIDYMDGHGMRRTRHGMDNGSSSLDGDDIKYIIIAGVVGGITVIISIIIVTIILLMRRPDNERTSGVAGVQEQGDGRHFEKQIWQSVPVDDVTPAETCEKAIDSMSMKGRRGVSPGCTLTLTPKTSNGGIHQNSNQDFVDAHTRKSNLEPYQEQHQLYTFKKSVLKPPTDDHQSDTSGETTTSDSGRGGSEEDIQLPPLPELCVDTSRIIFKNVGSGLKDSRFVQGDSRSEVMAFETFSPRTLPNSSEPHDKATFGAREVQTLGHSSRHDKLRQNKHGNASQTNTTSYSPTAYFSPGHTHQQQQQHSSPTSGPGNYPDDIPERTDSTAAGKRVTFQTDLTTQNLKTWELSQKLNNQPDASPCGTSSFQSNSGNQRIPGGNRPRSQDDDDNTTTSGSYTLNPENDFEEVFPMPYPVS